MYWPVYVYCYCVFATCLPTEQCNVTMLTTDIRTCTYMYDTQHLFVPKIHLHWVHVRTCTCMCASSCGYVMIRIHLPSKQSICHFSHAYMSTCLCMQSIQCEFIVHFATYMYMYARLCSYNNMILPLSSIQGQLFSGGDYRVYLLGNPVSLKNRF